MFRSVIKNEIAKCLRQLADGAVFSVSTPDEPEHGDYASNVAMVAAKSLRKNPKEVAEELAGKLRAGNFARSMGHIEVAGPGFLNFWIKRDALISGLQRNIVSKSPKKLFSAPKKSVQKIILEFVSANPTGPLTMANGRGGFYGDVLANILERAGHKVTREYYINDTGNQIKLLGESILAAEGNPPAGGPDREELYKGEYIKELKGKSAKQAAALLLKNIKRSLKNAGIAFDVWFSEEKNLHKTGELKKTLELLLKKKMLKEFEGALWLGKPDAGGAVLIKSDGSPTYFLADLAYHYDKFIKRKFSTAINIWGADHHGYIARMRNGVEALGVSPDRLHIIIMQLVRLTSGGKEVRMSKRAGNFVTLDELLEMVGADAARWFFLERSPDTHMDFDLDLARERSKKNPVYYVQYAHARACSILRKAKNLSAVRRTKTIDYDLLADAREIALIKMLLRLPEVIEDIAGDYQVQRLPKYAYELARSFTDFYEHCLVIDKEKNELTRARLALVSATQKVLADTLSLMGIDAPEEM